MVAAAPALTRPAKGSKGAASKAAAIAGALAQVSGFLKRIKETAEQLTQPARWRLILSTAFQQFLGGRVIGSTGRLALATS